MEKTLEDRSGILRIKSKFFIYRAVIYFSFLLIPVWIQKSLEVSTAIQTFVMMLYIMFMAGQWFFLGKEIDHRLKIYFRVNSSIDRIVYRLLLGMIAIAIYFNFLSFLPSKWIYNFFWITWVFLGLFYSWPTRGKIIQESVSSNLSEFKYLDSFEKTLVGLIILMFVVSIPELPVVTDWEGLRLFFDPLEKINGQFWNFLTVNYYPFKKYPVLYRLALSMHFYVVCMGVFLTVFYVTLRHFVSRRSSLLGVFALLSSWSYSKILGNNYGDALTTTYSLIWFWTFLWITKSSSYRVGLFLGLLGYWGTIINYTFSILLLIQAGLLYFFFLNNKTKWFKRQVLRYSLLGLLFAILTYFYGFLSSNPESFHSLNQYYLNGILQIINRKAFFILSFMGIFILLMKFLIPEKFENLQFERQKIIQFFTVVSILLIHSLFFDSYLVKSFSAMWFITLLSLVPVEVLFQQMSRYRSRRNMIYLIYIIICLLDSHFEGRIKIFAKLFNW